MAQNHKLFYQEIRSEWGWHVPQATENVGTLCTSSVPQWHWRSHKNLEISIRSIAPFEVGRHWTGHMISIAGPEALPLPNVGMFFVGFLNFPT